MQPCSDFPRYHFPFNETTELGRDRSGQKVYKFNSLGYRGEEYNADANFKIFLFGPSSALVTGLNIEEIYAYRFKEYYSEHNQIPIDQVNLMNFAVAGTSTDYNVRNLLGQCTHDKPDLVLFDLAHKSRMEWVRPNGSGISYGAGMPMTPKAFIELYSDEFGFVNLVKNILMIQFYCQANQIDYLILNRIADLDEFTGNTALNDYIMPVDRNRVCQLHQLEAIDQAADWEYDDNGKVLWHGHDGPQTNRMVAEQLFQQFLKTEHRPGTPK